MAVPRVTFIGAGSAVFARQLMTDILAVDGLEDGTFALVDVDPDRLELAKGIAERLVELTGKRWRVEASTERLDVLTGTEYVINSIEVAGLQNVRHDYEIPLRYGVDQCIGDTIGPGGIFKALRTGPAWLEIVLDIARVAPRAVVMNYTNPMSILTLAALKATDLEVVGRVKRSLLRVRALLPQAARSHREIHARGVSRGKRLLRQQLAAMETRQRRADRIDAARRLADPARART